MALLQAVQAIPGPYVDSAWPCGSPHLIAALKGYTPPGKILLAPKLGIGRYVPLPGVQSGGDITALELQALTAAELLVFLVQHVRYPGWDPTQHDGAKDGQHAADHALAVGYPAGAHLYLDLEGVGMMGTVGSTTAFASDWQRAVLAAGFRAGLYVGYAVPLSATDLFMLRGFNSYWSDAGPRVVAKRSFAIKQGKTVTIDGVKFDEDDVRPDLLGELPYFAGAASPLAA